MSTSITSPHALNANYKISEVSAEEFTVVDNKIDQFNAAQLSFTGTTQFYKNYVIQDVGSNIIAGINGCFYLRECLYISILFVNEDKRGQGLGNFLLEWMEQEAKKENIQLIHLDTFDFQAKDFYLKYGYEVFGVLDDCPKGHKRYYMKKKL
jgi:GNAT superfamily N-acetyltransferase